MGMFHLQMNRCVYMYIYAVLTSRANMKYTWFALRSITTSWNPLSTIPSEATFSDVRHTLQNFLNLRTLSQAISHFLCSQGADCTPNPGVGRLMYSKQVTRDNQ